MWRINLIWLDQKLGNHRIFFLTFSLSTFRFQPNTQNGKLGRKKLGKKPPRFPMFPTFSEFLIYHSLDFLIKCPSLSSSSNKLSFSKLCVFFYFIFLLCLNLLFHAIVGCNYPTCKCMFKVTQKKRNVHNICSNFKKLTKKISVTANRVWHKLRQVILYNL